MYGPPTVVGLRIAQRMLPEFTEIVTAPSFDTLTVPSGALMTTSMSPGPVTEVSSQRVVPGSISKTESSSG